MFICLRLGDRNLLPWALSLQRFSLARQVRQSPKKMRFGPKTALTPKDHRSMRKPQSLGPWRRKFIPRGAPRRTPSPLHSPYSNPVPLDDPCGLIFFLPQHDLSPTQKNCNFQPKVNCQSLCSCLHTRYPSGGGLAGDRDHVSHAIA